MPDPAITTRFLAARDRLYAYAYAVVRDPHLAEDVFQETWLALASACERGQAIDDLEGWCRGVARNLALKHWRAERARARPLDPRLVDLVDQAFSEAPADALGPLREALARCCARLSASARRLIELRYREGLAPDAIAQATRRTPRGVITMLARIRARLAGCVRRTVES